VSGGSTDFTGSTLAKLDRQSKVGPQMLGDKFKLSLDLEFSPQHTPQQ
jgi:hypothetical protein